MKSFLPYQLTCDPGFAIGEEPEVVTVRVTASGETGGSTGGSTPLPSNGAGKKPGGGSADVLLLLALTLLIADRLARQRRRALVRVERRQP